MKSARNSPMQLQKGEEEEEEEDEGGGGGRVANLKANHQAPI